MADRPQHLTHPPTHSPEESLFLWGELSHEHIVIADEAAQITHFDHLGALPGSQALAVPIYVDAHALGRNERLLS